MREEKLIKNFLDHFEVEKTKQCRVYIYDFKHVVEKYYRLFKGEDIPYEELHINKDTAAKVLLSLGFEVKAGEYVNMRKSFIYKVFTSTREFNSQPIYNEKVLEFLNLPEYTDMYYRNMFGDEAIKSSPYSRMYKLKRDFYSLWESFENSTSLVQLGKGTFEVVNHPKNLSNKISGSIFIEGLKGKKDYKLINYLEKNLKKVYFHRVEQFFEVVEILNWHKQK